MLAEEEETPSSYSADFRMTLRTLGAQARNAARWGHALLLISLILILLGGAFLGNQALAQEQEKDGDTGLWGSVKPVGWVSLVLALMRAAFLLLQRSWELENQLVRLRVRTDFLGNPRLAADMLKILEKESGRAENSRANNRLFSWVVRRRQGRPNPND
jgi:hypothetical protein